MRSQFSAGLEQRDIMKAGFRFSPPHYKNVVDGGNAIFTLSHDSVRNGDRHSFPEQIWQRRWKNDIWTRVIEKTGVVYLHGTAVKHEFKLVVN